MGGRRLSRTTTHDAQPRGETRARGRNSHDDTQRTHRNSTLMTRNAHSITSKSKILSQNCGVFFGVSRHVTVTYSFLMVIER